MPKPEPISFDSPNRRPIKSRGMQVFQSFAATLAGSSITPNMISVSSIVFSALACAAMLATNWFENQYVVGGCWLIGAAMIQGRLIANLLDGMVAMEGGKATAEGELYNEVPDRISDAFIFIGAGYALGGIAVFGWAASVVSVFVAYVRAIGSSVGAGQVFVGPMAKPHRMALMTVCCCALAGLAFFGVDHVWAKWTLNGCLAIVAMLGLLTSFRRLLIVANSMRQRQVGQ